MALPSKAFPLHYFKNLLLCVDMMCMFECMCAIVLTTHLYMGPRDQIQAATARALPAELCHQPLLGYYGVSRLQLGLRSTNWY